MTARLLRIVRALLLALGGLLLVVTFTPLVPWTAEKLSSNWTESDGDVLIMLTASDVEFGHPPIPIIGSDTYWRAVNAAYAWNHGHFRKMLVSGQGSANTVKPFLVFLGVQESAIVVEDGARSTHENALFSKPLLARMTGRFVLMTSDFHMYRASRCFAREQIPVLTRPFPVIIKKSNSYTLRWECFWALAGEIAKIGYYRVRGWI